MRLCRCGHRYEREYLGSVGSAEHDSDHIKSPPEMVSIDANSFGRSSRGNDFTAQFH